MVLDASGAVEFLLNTTAGKRLAARLTDEAETVHVPDLVDLEIAQVLRRYTRHGTLNPRMGALALDRWRSSTPRRFIVRFTGPMVEGVLRRLHRERPGRCFARGTPARPARAGTQGRGPA